MWLTRNSLPIFVHRRMLKKSLFSPTKPQRPESRFRPNGVLASLRGSTCRCVRLASSLSAALLDSLFEPPTRVFSSWPKRVGPRRAAVRKWFSSSLLGARATLTLTRGMRDRRERRGVDSLRSYLVWPVSLVLPVSRGHPAEPVSKSHHAHDTSTHQRILDRIGTVASPRRVV